MRKLLSLLVAAVLLPVAANADILKNVKLTGEIQTIASDVKTNADLLGAGLGNWYNHGAKTRALAGLSFDVVEDVTANVLFQYGYFWGTNNEDNNGFSNAEGAKLVNANVVLHNLFCNLEVTVGRQFYGDEDSAVMYIGPNHYNAETGLSYATAIDAVTATYGDDAKTLTLLAGTLYRAYDTDPTTGDLYGNTNIYGADLKLNLSDNLTAQVYGYDIYNQYDVDDTTAPWTIDYTNYDKHAGFYGAKLGLDAAVRMSAEYARNFGGKRLVKEHKDTGYMVKADVATDIKAVTARGTFVYAADAFQAMGNYTPGLLIGHPFAGDIFAFGNESSLRLFNLGFDMKPADKWTVSLDAYAYQNRNGKHSATWEGDVTAKYAHNENVELFAGFGYVKYGGDVADATTGDSYKALFGSENYKGQLGMLVRF